MTDYDYQQAYILTDRVTKRPVGFFGRDGKEYLIDFGGSSVRLDGEVDSYASLPTAADNAGGVYLVKQTTGVWLVNRRSGGLYLSDGVTWSIIIDYDTLVSKVNENTIKLDLKRDLLTWEYLAYNWTSPPVFNQSITGGDVYDYTLAGVTRYRYVPTVYSAVNDSFYSGFDGVSLTGLISSRG